MQIESADKEQTHEILSQIKKRWGPREFDPTKNISPSQISLLFEAARWAPSSFNDQPWNFIIVTKDYLPVSVLALGYLPESESFHERKERLLIKRKRKSLNEFVFRNNWENPFFEINDFQKN